MLEANWLTDDLEDAFKIRREVFVIEQGFAAEEEFDELDKTSFHLVLYDGKEPAATCRLYFKDEIAFIGRVAVLKKFRGQHLGDFIMRIAIRKAFDMGYNRQRVGAQVSAQDFYKKLGFLPFGDNYFEGEVLHIWMERQGDIGGVC